MAQGKILEHVVVSHLVRFLDFNWFFFLRTIQFLQNIFVWDIVGILHLSTLCNFGAFFTSRLYFYRLAKAFDKVTHKLLLKIRKLNLDRNIFAWLEQFLLQFTLCKGQWLWLSLSPLLSGVPQGFDPGPQFRIYIVICQTVFHLTSTYLLMTMWFY